MPLEFQETLRGSREFSMNAFRNAVLASAVAALGLGMGASEARAQYWPGYTDPNQVSFPVWQSGVRLNGYTWDARTGWLSAHTRGTTVYDSFNNPYRGWAQPGSVRYVNGWQYDASGAPVRVQGWQWTSINGQEHGNLSRTRVTPRGSHREQVYYHRR
jgi:hypothetical protein